MLTNIDRTRLDIDSALQKITDIDVADEIANLLQGRVTWLAMQWMCMAVQVCAWVRGI